MEELQMKRSLGAHTISFPLPAYLVGSYDKNGNPNVMMAAWGGICNSEPPCLAVSVRHSRWTFDAIMERKAFTVSIPSGAITARADYMGIASGKDVDKFAKAGLTPVRSDLVDAPYVAECPVVIEMTLYKTLELGSHVQFVGEIKDVKADAACLDEKGKIDIVKADPILFDTTGRNYLSVGAVTGKAWVDGQQFMK